MSLMNFFLKNVILFFKVLFESVFKVFVISNSAEQKVSIMRMKGLSFHTKEDIR